MERPSHVTAHLECKCEGNHASGRLSRGLWISSVVIKCLDSQCFTGCAGRSRSVGWESIVKPRLAHGNQMRVCRIRRVVSVLPTGIPLVTDSCQLDLIYAFATQIARQGRTVTSVEQIFKLRSRKGTRGPVVELGLSKCFFVYRQMVCNS